MRCSAFLTLIALLSFSCFMPGRVLAGAKTQEDPKYILVTGFEPFGGKNTNGSWESVQRLQDTVLDGKKIIVSQLPVIWEKAPEKLLALIRKYHPAAVVAFGEAGAGPVRVEIMAKNIRQNIPDNAGKMPGTGFIFQSAPPALRTTLNADRIIQRLHEAGIPAVLSQDAGGYLCNETFFNLMNFHGAEKPSDMRRGFIHVPPLNAQVVMPDGSTLLFNKALLEKTANIIVRAVTEGLS